MYNCLITDDEPLARQVLENYISRTPALRIAASCNNAVEAYQKLQELNIDILFLDIKMPLIDGLSFLIKVKNPPAVIFTTAFAEYAVKSYEMNAIDYLLKPFSYERFYKSIEKVMKIQPDAVATVPHDYLFIKTDNTLHKLLHHEILFIEARKDYLKIVTVTGSYLTHMTMKYIASLLPPTFVRIHRTYIIAPEAISEIGKD